ncbi:MAG TPA: dipeptidase [Pyrinomonadaceae bacterium]
MRQVLFILHPSSLILVFALAGCRQQATTDNTNMPDPTPQTNATATAADKAADKESDALSIHRRALSIDMHADTVQFILDEGADISASVPGLHLDAPRMRAGGLDAQFFSIWIEPSYYGAGGQLAVERADEQVAAVRALAEARPDVWALATTADEVRRAAGEGRLAALMGLEGGYALDERLENVEKYYRAGVRYLSPTWSVSLAWAGSSGDAAGQSRGLSDFGRRVIGEMNRLGIMVDVSHVSDKTFWDIIDASSKPVIATHSNARAIAPVARNLSDDMIRAIAGKGGVVCVVFYPQFIEPGWEEKKLRVDAEIAGMVGAASERAVGRGSARRIARDRVREREYARRLPPVSAARVVDHIDHIVRLVGVAHVGVGSDFDGIQAVPSDLSSVADLPNLTAELLRRGYKKEDIHKILGGNILRVMAEVEKH